MKTQLLTEHLQPGIARLTEQNVGGQLYLNGIMMQAELKNGNGRNYPISEISKAVDEAAQRIKDGHYILGELNHPDVLTVNLANVSHAITECRMDGNNAMGKMKLLNTPSGNIAKGLIEGGVRLGVSSRGTGNVNEGGAVSDFAFVTVDIVYQPSAPDAYPDVIAEAMNTKKVLSLAEAMVDDPKAQAYFKKEILNLLEKLRKGGAKLNEVVSDDQLVNTGSDKSYQSWDVQYKDSQGKIQTKKMKGKDVAEIKNIIKTKHKDCKFMDAQPSSSKKE